MTVTPGRQVRPVQGTANLGSVDLCQLAGFVKMNVLEILRRRPLIYTGIGSYMNVHVHSLEHTWQLLRSLEKLPIKTILNRQSICLRNRHILISNPIGTELIEWWSFGDAIICL